MSKADVINPNEQVYLEHLRKVLGKGKDRPDRTGTGTRSLFGETMRFDISASVPLLTTKFVPWKMCIKELLWFVRGDTDASILQRENVKIWDGNTTREFLDRRGLTDLPEGDIGAGYGFQWRHFGATYGTCKEDYTGQGFDQLEYVLKLLKEDPFSRRIYMTGWNPAALDRMALPPCHLGVQFYVEEDKYGERHLSCLMYQRSNDEFLGKPWNIFSYTVLTYLLAKKTGMKPKELVLVGGDCHIYLDHLEQVCEQLSRKPFAAPRLVVSEAVVDKEWKDITVDDFQVEGYEHHPAIKAKMSV